MVILITGASHTGKTLLAQRMLEKYKYPYLSIDHLKMGMIRSCKTNLTPEDDDALTDELWPIVREMIKTAIENHQNLIVEGGYIPINWKDSFREQYLDSIRFICLAFSDEYIDTHFDEIREHRSDIEARQDDGNCTIASLKDDNRRYIDGFKTAGEKVFLIMMLCVPMFVGAQTLTFTDHEPMGNMRTQVTRQFFRLVEQESKGRIRIDHHWNGELSSSYDAYETVREGTKADMATVVPEYDSQRMPLHQLFKSFLAGPSGEAQVALIRKASLCPNEILTKPI